ARRVPADRRAARVRKERGNRPRVLLTLEALEEKQLVLHDRTTHPFTKDRRLERAGVEHLAFRFVADVRLVPGPGAQRTGKHVAAAARYRVHAGADEVALTDIERRDVHLYLFDRFERDWSDTGPIARLALQTERVVEIRAVDGNVVHPVVLTGEV